jgi:hypothetical protein
MSSSSPRNANSRSKASLTESRKRTQEVETGEGSEGRPGEAVAIAPAPGATPAQLATSALDAADQAVRAVSTGSATGLAEADADAKAETEGNVGDGPDAGPARAGGEPRKESDAESGVESFVGSEASPLGREILGAAQDMAGEWAPEPRPVPGAAPATPLELLDETDLITDGPPGGASGLIVAPRSPPAMRDEEFLRRVVLPPLPSPAAGVQPQRSFLDEDSEDKTVISDPPSPEMVASWGRPSRASATARAFKRHLKARVELTTLKLLGLLSGSALAGGVVGALLMSVPQAAADRQVVSPTVVVGASDPPQPAAVPSVTPLPPLPLPPQPTVESLPTPEDRLVPAEGTTTTRVRKSARRSAASRKAAKKEWVDPFEQ